MNSLRGRLLAGTAAIFAVALMLVLVGQWLGARAFLLQQLASHAQESADALSLSLAGPLSSGDKVLADTTVLAVFDRGYFSRIAVRDTGGAMLVEHVLAPVEHAVPIWFEHLAALDAPAGRALVSAGWKELGRVEVTVHPRFAQERLWHDLWQVTGALAFAYGLALLLVHFLLNAALRPVHAIEDAAEAVARRQYRTVVPLKRPRELVRLVEVFNRLVVAVRGQIEAETARAEAFRRQATFDAASGLLNRAGFAEYLEHACTSEGTPVWLGLLEWPRVAGLNLRLGHRRVDRLVGDTAGEIRAVFGDFGIGRLRAGNVAWLAPWVGEGDATAPLQALSARLGVLAEALADDLDAARPALVLVPLAGSAAQTLARADRALARAQGQGLPLLVGGVDCDEPAALSAAHRRAVLLDALERGAVTVARQTVADAEGVMLHEELFARVQVDGRGLEAAELLPLALHHGLQPRLDLAVLEQALALQRDALDGPRRLAVNWSAQSWCDAAWVDAACRRHRVSRADGSLVVEIAESDALRHPERAAALGAQLAGAGIGLAVDHAGMTADGLRCALSLNAAYVKLARAFAAATADEARFEQLLALGRAAAAASLPLIVTGVETAAMYARTRVSGVTGWQGRAVATEREGGTA